MKVLVIHYNGITESHNLQLKNINVYYEAITVSEKQPFTLIKPQPYHKHRLFFFEDNIFSSYVLFLMHEDLHSQTSTFPGKTTPCIISEVLLIMFILENGTIVFKKQWEPSCSHSSVLRMMSM